MEELLRAQIRESEQKAEQLSTLCEAGKIISSSLSLEEVLGAGLNSTLKLTKADGGSIMLLDEETGGLIIKMARGLSKKAVQNVSRRLGEGIAGRVAETGKPLLLVNDKVEPELKPLLKRRNIRGSMTVPLKVRERVIGVLNVHNKTSTYTFNEDDLGLISALTGQLATAIENAKFYESAQRDRKELDMKVFNLFALFEASRALGPPLGIEEILKLAIDMFIELIRTERGLIMMLEEEMGGFVPRATKGLSKDLVAQAKFEIGEHETQQLLQLEGPISLTDADSKLKDYCPALYQKLKRIGMELCIPLATRDKLIGLVALSKKLVGAGFSAGDLEFLSTVAKQVVSSLENARLVKAIQKNCLDTISSLAMALEAKDVYTRGHSERVTKYAMEIARQLGLSEKEVETIRRAGLLHDIGKIGISELIMGKPGKLTEAEFATIRLHPVIGDDITKGLEFLAPCRPIIRHHHERWDGGGYPDGLSGEAIPLGARILAVADTFDAMASARPYRKEMSVEDACAEIERCKDTQFDPRVADAFLRMRESISSVLLMSSHPGL